MSLMDFFYLRDRIWKAGTGDPRENNTLLLTGIKELRTEADVAWVKRELDSMADEPVAYLGSAPLPHASIVSGNKRGSRDDDQCLFKQSCIRLTVSHVASQTIHTSLML